MTRRSTVLVALAGTDERGARWELVERPVPGRSDAPPRVLGPTDFPAVGLSVGPGC